MICWVIACFNYMIILNNDHITLFCYLFSESANRFIFVNLASVRGILFI